MASLIRPLRKALSSPCLKALLLLHQHRNPTSLFTARNYIFDMRKSAFPNNILRLLSSTSTIDALPNSNKNKNNNNNDKNKNNNNNNNNNKDNADGKIESSLSTYSESYRQLDNLNFMTAARILFTQPSKKKKFGLDFHLVQFFFACMPSLAVYLVAQYARYEMRKMEVELEEKKKEEEEAKRKQEEEEEEKEKKKQEEEKAKETERIATDPELLEVKKRLGKLEEAVKEIIVESKKQSVGSVTKTQQNASEQSKDKSAAESGTSMEQVKVTKQNSTEQTPDRGKVVSDSSQKYQKGENRMGRPSQDAKR